MRHGRRFTQRALLRGLRVPAQEVSGPSPRFCEVKTSEARSYILDLCLGGSTAPLWAPSFRIKQSLQHSTNAIIALPPSQLSDLARQITLKYDDMDQRLVR
jgi:hypothetical protein